MAENEALESQEPLSEEDEILSEIATNERIVTHTEYGTVRLVIPTLKTQKLIDAAARKKRKELKAAVDEIEDKDNPGKTIKIPAYRSRATLRKEYIELDWWSDEQEEKLQELSGKHVMLLAELELLGFESENGIYEEMANLRTNLKKEFEKYDSEDREEILVAIDQITLLGAEGSLEDEKVLRTAALSTTVDDLLDELTVIKRLYDAYIEILNVYNELSVLQQEEMQLFSDSWQEQLRYYIRLAQVFYCITKVQDGEPLWPSLQAVETETNIEKVRWAFDELNAFWQGLTEETRERMGKYNFILGRGDEMLSSAESPETLEFKIDGDLQEEVPTASIEASVTQDLSVTSNLD
jgi:hypothetical protein